MADENGQLVIVPNLQLFAEEGQPDPAPAEPTPDDSPPEGDEPATFEVDGTSYTQDQIKEALKIQKDFELDSEWKKANTERAEQLAEERRNLKHVQDLEEFLTTNPDAREKLQATMDEYVQGTQSEEKPIDPTIERKLTSTEQRIEDFIAKQELRQQINDLHINHSDEMKSDPELEKKIVQVAYERKLDNLEDAFKILKYDETASKKLEEGQEIVKDQLKRSEELAVPGGTKPSKPSYKGKSPQDLMKSMMDSPYLNDE